MKTKYFLIYVFVGLAFLAVCAWVFFSRGKNARALRAKYRLGGIMLTCISMLSFASCENGGPFQVTCYDPVVEVTEDIVSVSIKSQNATYKYNEISPGDVIAVSIEAPTFEKYLLRVILNNKEGTELQRASLVINSGAQNSFEVMLSPDLTYKGEALIELRGVIKADPEELSISSFGNMVISIL